MKQKIVVEVDMKCGKCRTKAMKIAASESGVTSVQISGESKDQVVVIGEVDSVSLTRSLRKKVGSARLVNVEEVKEIVKVEEAPKKEDNVQASSNDQSILSPYYNMTTYPQPWVYYEVVHAKNPDFCCIL